MQSQPRPFRRSLLSVSLSVLWVAADAATVEAEPELPPGWVSDLDHGLALARDQQKDLVVLLTHAEEEEGSFRHALTQAWQKDGAALADRMLLVPLRYSRIDDDPRANATFTAVADRFSIRKLPAAILLDRDGGPVGVATLSTSSVEELHTQIAALHARRVSRDDLFAQADAATADERARLLDRALAEVQPFAASDYESRVRQVLALDPTNAMGLRERYAPALAQRAIDHAIQHEVYPLIDRTDYRAARTRLTELKAMPDLSVDQRQLLAAFAAQLLYTLGERSEALAELDAAIALAPHTPAADRIRSAKAQMQAGDEPG